MKIIVLHGDHSQASYERLQKFIEVAKKRNWEIQRIDSNKSLSLPEALTSTALFASNRLFILEGIKNIKKQELDWLAKKSAKIEGNLVIYHDGFIPSTFLKSLPKNTKIEEFKLPRLIFTFLDSFSPKNSQKTLKLFHQVSEKEPVEFIFAILAKHLRDLHWVKVDAEGPGYPSWRISKLKKQAKLFSESLLKEVISDLAEADVKAKTSKASLKDSLDFLIATKLE